MINRHYLFFILIALTSSVTLAQSRVDSIRAKLFNPNLRDVIVVAHRGDWRNFPENSIAAIDNAVKMGVDVVEVDVQRTRDGQLILMHDTSLDRTTTGKGKIKEVDLDSINKLNLKNGCAIKTIHKVPTLRQALLHARGKIMLNLDKADRYFDEVYKLLEETGTTKQIIMKGTKPPKDLRKQYGSYLNQVIYMPIVKLDNIKAEEYINEFIRDMKPVAFELLYTNDSNKLPLKIKKELKGEALIWYNTLWDTMAGGHDDDMSLENPDKGYGYLIDTLGARIIQTDRPEYLLKYLRTRGLHN